MKPKRPGLITAICILSFIFIPISLVLVTALSEIYGGMNSPVVTVMIVGSILGLICFIGMWMMKKWSVILYAIVFALTQVILLSIHQWNALALLSIVVLVIGFSYYDKMT